jgi:alpha,alpha-trehalose phosphorylase
MDLRDLEHNTRDGVHIASLAGAWMAAVAGFGGMRDYDGELTFAPRLPARLTRLRFRLVFRGRHLRVDVTKRNATYTLLDGEPLCIAHHGTPLDLTTAEALTEEIPSLPERPRPSQPHGREPVRRAPNGS